MLKTLSHFTFGWGKSFSKDDKEVFCVVTMVLFMSGWVFFSHNPEEKAVTLLPQFCHLGLNFEKPRLANYFTVDIDYLSITFMVLYLFIYFNSWFFKSPLVIGQNACSMNFQILLKHVRWYDCKFVGAGHPFQLVHQFENIQRKKLSNNIRLYLITSF